MIDLKKATLKTTDGRVLKFLKASLWEAQERIGIPDSEIWKSPCVEEISRLTISDHMKVDGIGYFSITMQYRGGVPEHGIFSWEDCPLSKTDWERVTLHDLHLTVAGISRALELLTGLKPLRKRKLSSIFKLKWGTIRVSGEEHSYSASAILIKNS